MSSGIMSRGLSLLVCRVQLHPPLHQAHDDIIVIVKSGQVDTRSAKVVLKTNITSLMNVKRKCTHTDIHVRYIYLYSKVYEKIHV